MRLPWMAGTPRTKARQSEQKPFIQRPFPRRSASSFDSSDSGLTPPAEATFVTSCGAYPFPPTPAAPAASMTQYDEKHGPIQLLESPFSTSLCADKRRKRRRFLQFAKRILPVGCLYLSVIALFVLVLMPKVQAPQTWSMLYGRATQGSPLYRDLAVTLGVVPKRVHSHNDYEQPVPLYTALAFGASSVEADVWLVDGEVRVAHHKRLATPGRTLRSLYIDPLVSILQKGNAGGSNGIFPTAPSITLQFLIDFKEDTKELYDAVLAELQPLRSQSWLTTYNGTMYSSAITVVGSGDARLDLIRAQSQRDLFYDAPLDKLSRAPYDQITPSISPMASVNLAKTGFNPLFFYKTKPFSTAQEWIDLAHSKGIAARFWGGPRRPTWLRYLVWNRLVSKGVGWLDSDYMMEATMF